jgi:hypothetical protein
MAWCDRQRYTWRRDHSLALTCSPLDNPRGVRGRRRHRRRSGRRRRHVDRHGLRRRHEEGRQPSSGRRSSGRPARGQCSGLPCGVRVRAPGPLRDRHAVLVRPGSLRVRGLLRRPASPTGHRLQSLGVRTEAGQRLPRHAAGERRSLQDAGGELHVRRVLHRDVPVRPVGQVVERGPALPSLITGQVFGGETFSTA